MSIRDGGPAFPRPLGEGGGEWNDGQEGMSLRDYFAGHALAGLVGGLVRAKADDLAEQAYELADALLAHRDKPPVSAGE